MPELPETETIARDLDAAVRGARIAAAQVPRPDVLREVSASVLGKRVANATIEHCWRRAKCIVLDLSSGDHIVVQPRFTGGLVVDDGTLDADATTHIAVSFSLADGRTLAYRDVRRLGTVALMNAARFADYSAAIGPEPLDTDFSAEALHERLRPSRQPVKKMLMDQRTLAGVGNIYANEALWRAGVDPSREARSISASESDRMYEAIVTVLRESIAARGTSFRDYRDARGQRGDFVRQLAVYGRGGEPCNRCGRRLVETHAIDGRTTVLCVECQR